MPIPWNMEKAKTYWQNRLCYMLDRGVDVNKRTMIHMQSLRKKEDEYQSCMSTIRSQLPNAITDASTKKTIQSLGLWIRTLSWNFCPNCSSLLFQNLMPGFKLNKQSKNKPFCQCSGNKYFVPQLNAIPPELRTLQSAHVKALRPFDVDTGTYERLKYGYRKKTGLLRLTCSKLSVRDKILALPDWADQQICANALQYLLANTSSSYKFFYDMRNDLVSRKEEPNLFDVYKWCGIECALWPNLYPFKSWCETSIEGTTDRKSSKISYLTKCFSSIVDYSMTFDLLQFVFDRWLYKTVTGAINSAHLNSTQSESATAFYALQDKPFCTGYWDWQHRYLLDAVRQFGLPSLFITISPSEWSFPLPLWLQAFSSNTGYGPTRAAFFETMHFVHILEQIVRGYLCGSNSTNWTNHLFSYNHIRNKRNVKTYFYRFEFQKRGTVHIHVLVWLTNIAYIDYKHIRGDFPTDDASLFYCVNKFQRSNKSSLPVHNGPTTVQNVDGKHNLRVSHTAESYSKGLRGYIDPLLQTLHCSMDVQTTSGKGMILKYVSSYVSKAKECFHNDAFYCKTLSPSTAAVRYGMSLELCEPEMWALLSSKKLSWTNASRKKYVIPDGVEKAKENATLQKYYTRHVEHELLCLVEWLRLVDDTSPLLTPYPAGKIVLVGLKHLSIFNPVYFLQYMISFLPHRSIDSLIPDAQNIPGQILYFNKAASLMPETFADPSRFVSALENEGHKRYYIETVTSYLQSLIDLNNIYRRQLLPMTVDKLPRSNFQKEKLQGSQTVFYTYFKKIMTTREESLFLDRFQGPTDLDWRKFPLLLGKPGSGKSFTIEACIQYCLEEDYNVCVGVPTGTLACTFRHKFGKDIVCDTVHGLFQFQSQNNADPQVNWMLSRYDVIFIDEISQVSVDMFHHILSTVSVLLTRPVVILCGDFAQQQPLSTIQNRTVQVPNIMSCSHCMSHTCKFTIGTQFRSQDCKLLQFLHHIRYEPPTQVMLNDITKGRILCPEGDVNESIYSKLRQYPDAVVITVTRKACTYINDILIKHLFPSTPLGLVVMDNETLIPIHNGMKLLLTHNINKSIGFVNGQFVTVKGVASNTIIAAHPMGHIINIFPITTEIRNVPITRYPCLPGYATTITKMQGQTLKQVIIWFDRETTPPGTAYVALSRAKKLDDIRFMTTPNRRHFTIVNN